MKLELCQEVRYYNTLHTTAFLSLNVYLYIIDIQYCKAKISVKPNAGI